MDGLYVLSSIAAAMNPPARDFGRTTRFREPAAESDSVVKKRPREAGDDLGSDLGNGHLSEKKPPSKKRVTFRDPLATYFDENGNSPLCRRDEVPVVPVVPADWRGGTRAGVALYVPEIPSIRVSMSMPGLVETWKQTDGGPLTVPRLAETWKQTSGSPLAVPRLASMAAVDHDPKHRIRNSPGRSRTASSRRRVNGKFVRENKAVFRPYSDSNLPSNFKEH